MKAFAKQNSKNLKINYYETVVSFNLSVSVCVKVFLRLHL